MSDNIYLSFTDISFKNKIGDGPSSSTYYSLLENNLYKCASKVLSQNTDDFNEKFQKYAQMLARLKHQGIIPFIGMCRSNENAHKRNILVFKYASNLSLQHVLDEPKNFPWYDLSRQFIIIYGIAQTMKFLHSINTFHGRLTPSNILIDENFEPKISDINFSLMLTNTDLSIENLKKYNLYNYIDPFTLKNGEVTGQSDVFAFATIALQILSGSNIIYDEEDVEELIKKIKTENLQPMIPSNFPDELKELLSQCLNEDPILRPHFQTICTKLESIISTLPEIPTDLFNEYKEKIESPNFTVELLKNDEFEPQNHDNNKFEAEEEYYNKHDNEKNEFVRLIDDPYFDKPKIDLTEIFNQIESNLNQSCEFTCDNPEEIEKLNFIQTEGAKKRLQKIADYIKVNVPVLLEGPTGTSKTLSSEIVCKALHLELIRFNLSSETKTQDLIGRYIGDENSWAGITMKDGPFFEAFSKGKVLLLDEINLAPPSVLQCIEEALDSGYLSIEIPGRPLKSIKRHEKFRLIATQNPNKGLFANKRQNLGLKFYSRFQVISFPAFTCEELEEIGLKLAHNFNYDNDQVVKELVAFHKEWSDYREKTNDPQCFTVREIAATVYALGKKETIYDTIMTIYGARYQKCLKDELKEKLRHYPHLNENPEEYKPPQFPGCYMNESLKSAIKSIYFSFKNHRHVILTGKGGCGKTQLAIWSSEYYNNSIKNENQVDESFFCVCTEEIKVADLVGHSSPSGNSDGISELIVWQDGFLTKAIKQGKCCVLESLDEAPATVTERLNGLLDQKYDNQEQFFDIPESSSCPRVSINENFRILATCNIDKITKMSPALLNRFDIVVLENQIDNDLDRKQFDEMIKILLDRYCSNVNLSKEGSEETEDKNDENNDDEFDQLFDFHEDDKPKEKVDKNDNKDKEEVVASFRYSEKIIPLIYEKLKNKTNISYIARICKAVIKLLFNFQNNATIAEEKVVDFAFHLFDNNSDFTLQKEIEEHLIKMLHSHSKNYDAPFFYLESVVLKNFFAKLMAYSLIEQPVCITGPTGVGKTSASRAFSMVRPCKSNDPFGFQFHSFHSGTKVSHFFGTTVLSNGEIQFHDGTLTTALKKGLVFIADEFNLSTQSVMKSLALALDPTVGRNAYIPGTGQNISISSDFFFIACQNELGTIGRNAIPDSIIQRFVEIDYPVPENEDIQKICIEIAKDNLPADRKSQFNEDGIKLARSIGHYMIQLNDLKLTNIPQWSFRDITKLFKRIYNQENNQNFIGITPYHHILFYTLSSVSPEEADKTIDKIKITMKISFELDDSKLNDLFECYSATPEIRRIENQGFFIMKKNSGISIENLKQVFIDKSLPSLLNTIFKVSLADEREPILLMGNSGFKTFLANQFLPSAQIISLNQETTVAQLIGSSCFMNTSQANLFYIEYICKILQRDSQIIDFRKKLENKTLTIDEINEIIRIGKRSTVPESFYYALDHLKEMLFNKSNEHSKESILSNTVIEFRPGLFFDAILQRQSLILKDLSNLPTIVLERFNELFSGRQNLTLSEDIHNTFTPENEKELTDFNISFRIFATCPSNSPTKLSDAVLSRFSVIYAPEYSSNEQEIVLRSYIHNDTQFNSEDINKLTDFAKFYKRDFKRNITFPQMIKIIELTSQLNKKTSIENQNHNMGIILYRFLGGLMESKIKRNKLFKAINFKSFDLPDIYKSINDDKDIEEENYLSIETKFDTNGVLSKMSNLFLKSSSAKWPKTIVAFTKSFNDLLDLIHLSLTIHNPIILEGPPGQGKHMAINYIAEMLNIEVVQIMISQSTKVEDLFGKEEIYKKNDKIHIEMVETKFVSIIKSGVNYNHKSLIILENINNATPAVLNALVPVFNTNSSRIFLPNGTTIEKGQFDIIGIFNTQQISSSKDKLPSSLINSSIYHVVSKADPKEILNIILTKFTSEGFSQDEALRFNEAFNKARGIYSNEVTSFELFSLNDINKYLLFRSYTKDCFDETTILQMIFAYRFSNDEMIQNMLQTLNLESMKFNPIFSYNVPPTDLYIRINNSNDNSDANDNNSNKVLSLKSKAKDISILSKINTLTLPQKHCLIFLACSLLSKRSCVIQGDTASGKSHLVRLFAELLGKKLVVFQMNNDSNITMLAGQSILDDSISEYDKKCFTHAFQNLCVEPAIDEYLNDSSHKINIKDPLTWNPKVIKNLLNFIKIIEPSINRSKFWPEVQASVQLIKETMNPINRFHRQKSEFINALLEGHWVLIDGIESAPSTIAEKITSLCGEKPELNLYEFGQEFFFSIDSTKKDNRIHKNFHLFITYNPLSIKESQMIDQGFLTKSVTFTLPPMDEVVENSAQILFGSLINQSYPNNLSKELAARLAKLHDYAKRDSIKNPDDFAGDIPYHGRILTFAAKSFSFWREEVSKSFFKDIAKPICFLINSFYSNSYLLEDNLQVFKQNCFKKFKEDVKYELMNSLQTSGVNLRERNELALITIRNIQKNILLKEEYHYSLLNLLDNFSFIRISDVSYVQKHIKDVIQIMESNLKSQPDLLLKYGSLYIIRDIFESILNPEEPIKKEHTFLTLKDKELRNDESIKYFMSKLDLLNVLLSENLFLEESSLLLNKSYLESISLISATVLDQQKNSILNLFKFIKENYDAINFIDKMFPYQFFKNSSHTELQNVRKNTDLSMVLYWIPLVKLLIEKDVHFKITIENETVDFTNSTENGIVINLLMNEENNLSLSKGSEIQYDKDAKPMSLPQGRDNLMFYTISELAHNLKNEEKIDFKNTFRTCFNNAKNKLKSTNFQNQNENKIIYIQDIFVKKDISNICMIWNLVYTLSGNQIQELSNIINPIESQLLTTISYIYNTIDQLDTGEIIKWCKWAEFLTKYTINLLRIILNNNDKEDDFCPSNIDSLILSVQKEKNYLLKSPNNKFWNSKMWIEVCEKEYNRLIKLKAQKDHKIHELEIEKKLQYLSKSLDDKKINDKYHKMRDEIVKHITNITEYTDEKYQFAKDIVDQFIKLASLNNTNKEKVFIDWPIDNIVSENSNIKSESIKVFEELIWYSKILYLLKEINNNKDLLANIQKLGEFPEMGAISKILLAHLIQNSKIDNSGLTSNDKNEAKYFLEAKMFVKLYFINKSFIKDNKLIFDIINNYAKRNNYCDEREIQWIYRTNREIPSDFVLKMPKIEPNALVFLMVNRENDDKYMPGPLCRKNKELNMSFLQDIASLMNENFDSFRDATKAICQKAYHSFIQSENPPPKDYQSLKKVFDNIKVDEDDKRNIFASIQTLIYFSECLETWKEHNILFDDISFLQKEWNQLFNDDDLLNKYPSLLYWFCKNEQCTKQLMKTFNNFKPKQNEIPFWLICLRILSSKQCIKFETNNQNKMTSIINVATKEIISDNYLKQNKISYNWLNILIENVPQELFNDDIKIIHDFLYILSSDDHEIQSEIIEENKYIYLKDSISEMFKIIVYGKTNNLLNSNFAELNLIVNFLTYPSKSLNEYINKNMRDIAHSILIDESYKKLKKFLKDKEILDHIIVNLKKAINDDEAEFKIHYEEHMKNENEKQKKTKISVLFSKIIQYNSIIDDYSYSKIVRDKVPEAMSTLESLYNELKVYPELFSGQYLTVPKIKFNNTATISRDNQPYCQTIINNPKFHIGNIHYLFPGEYIPDIYNYGIEFFYENIWTIKDECSKSPEYIENIINLDCDLSKENKIPILIFGDRSQTSKDFIRSVEDLNNLLNTSLNTIIFKTLQENQNIFNNFFNVIPQILEMIKKIKSNLNVQFSNNSSAPRTKEIINGELHQFLENLEPLLSELNNLVKSKLYPIWDATRNIKAGKLFKFNYDIIKIPKSNSLSNVALDFTNLSKIDSLASPIFCLSSDNHIICSINELKCQIGPIFPSLLLSRSILINLISFINGDISVSIEQLSDSQYSNLIKTKEKLTDNEPVQLFIVPPEIKKSDDEIIALQGKLKIEANGTQALHFPFDITLVLMPLKFRLRCHQFPLSEINKNYFRLCCSRIDSGQTIDFEIINYYIIDQFILDVKLESLDENQAVQPKINIEKHKRFISLTMPQVNEPTRCQFDTIIKLSKNLEIKVRCDFIISPFDFSLEMYDYCKKEFTSDFCQLIITQGLTQKLYFRVFCFGLNKEKGKITTNFPKFMNVRSRNIPLNSNFEVKGDFSFFIEVHAIESPLSQPSHGITLEIGNIKKILKFIFVDPLKNFQVDTFTEKNTDYLKKFPCYSYLNDDKKWIKLNNNEEMRKNRNKDVPFIIVSPFLKYENCSIFTELKYDLDESIQIATQKNKHAKFIQIALSDSLCETKLTDTSHKTEEEKMIKDKKIFINYFSIIGFIDEDKNNWFPVFNEYPYIKNVKQLPYEEGNSKKAAEFIGQMFSHLKCKSKDVVKELQTRNSRIKQTNSAILLALFLCKKVIFNIESIIDQFPSCLISRFENILKDIRPYINQGDKLSKDLISIISNNLIITFVQVFYQRYYEIRSHLFCLEMPLTNEEIEKQKNAAYQELMLFNSKNVLERNNNVKAQINHKERELSKVSVEELPDESNQYECFLISENADPKPCKPSDELGKLSFEQYYEEESVNSNTADVITSLPEINPPKDTIADHNLFYLSCAQGASVLPTVIRSRQIKKLDQNETEKYFLNLLNIYIEITKNSVSNKSILSSSINRFIESFKNCVKRLRRAGANFNKVKLPQSLNGTSDTQDFIWIPGNEIPKLSSIPWKIKNKSEVKNKGYNDDIFFKTGDLHIEESTNVSSSNILPKSILNDKKEEENQNLITLKIHSPLSVKQKSLIIQKVAIDLPKSPESEDIMNDVDEDEEDSNDCQPVFHIEANNAKMIDVKSDYFESIYNEIDEIDILKFIINRINQMDPNGQLEFLDNMNNNFIIQHQDELFETDCKDFPVNDLIDKSQYLIYKLIAGLSNSNCSFMSISCNLLIDCSNIISNQCKLFNFMLLASFSYALSALEIPFTISIFADRNFRFVMKSYEENISLKVLQRVLDCLFIKRYRANIADTLHYVIDVMKHPQRTQRAIFVFTDGLDENFVLAKSWKNLLLNNPKLSFGFLFSKSKLINDPKYEIIEKMWKKFEKVVSSAQSTTKLSIFSPAVGTSILNSLTRIFVDVLSSQNLDNQDVNALPDIKPVFNANNGELTEDTFKKIERNMSINFGNFKSPIFRKVNQMSFISGTRFDKLDVNHYRSKTGKIAASSVHKSIREDFDRLILQNMFVNRNSFRHQLESIFKPNKASQVVLSSTGTDFDITALILNLINPVPNPLIYLEEKGGLTRNYGVSIVIDSSISCFNQFSSSHSYQTMKILFSALESIEIPFVDVIIATDEAPIILSSEIPSKRLFNRKSTFWPSLFNTLSMKMPLSCNLESAIHAAYDIRRMRSVDSTSYLFVLTDGLFEKDQKESIKKNVVSCAQNGILTFGIGIGIYPIGIDKLFPNVIFSPNPKHLINGIASFFDNDSSELYDNSIKVIMPDKLSGSLISTIFKKLIEKSNNPIFKDLKNYLSDTHIGMDAFSHVYNKEHKKVKNSMNQIINQEGEMYEKDLFKGQKILIVMPYDATMNLKENAKLLPENLFKASVPGQSYVKEAVEFYGIDIKVVQNYKDAINELTKETFSGKCEYYAMWILSGLPYDVPLADSGNQNLVYQFTQCAIQFWEKGGAIVLFAEGDPLTFQANLFLQMVSFPGKQKKTKLQLSGSHEGKKILYADETGLLDKPGTFNKSPNEYKKFHRAPLGHNIYQIYEGETISYVPDNKSLYSPFVPFMRDSEGAISALFYPGDRDQQNRRGDIIIDCGYSKLFDAMTTEGTFKYIQNMAAWTCQYESRFLSMKNPEKFTPKSIEFTLNESVSFDGFKAIPRHLALKKEKVCIDRSKLNGRLFAIDTSGSVNGDSFYFHEINSILKEHYQKGDEFIVWNSTYKKVTFFEINMIINDKRGNGGTHPSQIIRACLNHQNIRKEHLILITDGRVSYSSINESDLLIKQSNLHFKYVTTYIIGDQGDLSVGAPFARGCGSKTIEIKSMNQRREIYGANEKDFNSLNEIDNINNVNQFVKKFDELFNATKQKMIGTNGDPQLKVKYERMKERINHHGSVNSDVSRKITALIRMASGAIMNVFDSDQITAMNF